MRIGNIPKEYGTAWPTNKWMVGIEVGRDFARVGKRFTFYFLKVLPNQIQYSDTKYKGVRWTFGWNSEFHFSIYK